MPKGPPIADGLELSRTKPWARVRVPLDGSTWKSSWRLRQGARYKVTVAGLVLLLWTHAVVWLPFLALWLRHGFAQAITLIGVGVASLLVAVPLAALAGASRAWGPWLYGPVAVIAATATAAWVFP